MFIYSSSNRKSIAIEAEDLRQATQMGKIIENESTTLGQVNWGIYLKYLVKVGPGLSIASLALVLVNEAFAVAGNLWMTKWSSDKESAKLRNYYLTYYALLGVGRVFSMFCGSLLFSWAALNGQEDAQRFAKHGHPNADELLRHHSLGKDYEPLLNGRGYC